MATFTRVSLISFDAAISQQLPYTVPADHYFDGTVSVKINTGSCSLKVGGETIQGLTGPEERNDIPLKVGPGDTIELDGSYTSDYKTIVGVLFTKATVGM